MRKGVKVYAGLVGLGVPVGISFKVRRWWSEVEIMKRLQLLVMTKLNI